MSQIYHADFCSGCGYKSCKCQPKESNNPSEERAKDGAMMRGSNQPKEAAGQSDSAVNNGQLTQEKLKEILDYDPMSGVFVWKVNVGAVKAGSEAGCFDKRGYRQFAIGGRNYFTHRLAWLYVYGKFPEKDIDHINGIKDDNRIENLRVVTNQENQRNSKRRSDNSSGVTGVTWRKKSKKWQTSIKVSGKTIHLGMFSEIEDAAAARKEAEKKYDFHPNHGRSE